MEKVNICRIEFAVTKDGLVAKVNLNYDLDKNRLNDKIMDLSNEIINMLEEN